MTRTPSKCPPTQTPGNIDIPALREKYREEREKRFRSEGQKQYFRPKSGVLAEQLADPYKPVLPRAAISEEIDVAVLGGGFTGILASVQLRKAGVTRFRNIEQAGDFGGVWYWNRYPGIQCDNESYCYLPLLEETGFVPSKRFSDGTEIQGHCVRIARQFGLYDGALFHTQVKSLRWDESIKRWHVSTDRGDEIRARFVIMAGGPLNRPKLPGIPGLQDFKGQVFHSARWDYGTTGGSWESPVLDKLTDKRVAVVGTGATAIQIVPYLGKYAREVYVLQRTPPSVDARPNPPTDPDWVKTLQPGWQKQRQENFHRGAMEGFHPGDSDLVCDFWTEINRNVAAKLAAQGWPAITPETFMAMREDEDFHVMERFRRRIDEIVQDKATAELLKPWFRFHCKRPLSSDSYYPTFNRPNVHLIDVSATKGVERLTEHGFVHEGKEYPIDLLICASGFEVTSDLDLRWGIDEIQGRDQQSLYDYWADGYKTLHGVVARGFPNQFFTGYIQGGLYATTVEQFNRQGHHIAHIISEALKQGISAVEPTQQAQDAWVQVMAPSTAFSQYMQSECPPSYLNNESGKFRYYLGEFYLAGFTAFEQLLQDWRGQGAFEGMELDRGITPTRKAG
ncbi:NAD(P)/FAD-dependent oxidoreductase [Solimonas sp. K1W22B-7]|uniref:flavin-containing monooxygenase n=1 Tax=Solimonas sp. K1W22B-7 TaxID=2303331 RepID=UPI000E334E8C|nr:NAD(P)/FAD-dependent oxidoreductase [Solimonas sp. K1W22B-7]AXQ28539.1 NAD(P)/FAD-dependent oxidoreductase [Solimonas sp. K1W22B-7]